MCHKVNTTCCIQFNISPNPVRLPYSPRKVHNQHCQPCPLSDGAGPGSGNKDEPQAADLCMSAFSAPGDVRADLAGAIKPVTSPLRARCCCERDRCPSCESRSLLRATRLALRVAW